MTADTGPRPLRVVHFGTYDRGVGRNAILAEGLRAAGVEVIECHVPVWRDTSAKLAAARHASGAVGAALRQALASLRLIDRYRRIAAYDVLLVGATAHLDLPLARRLARRRGRPLVFDPLVSLTETVRDRALIPESSRRFRLLAAVERALFRLPDACLVDTAAHGAAFRAELGVPANRAIVIPVGAPSIYRNRARPYAADPSRPVRVVYFGQYIPLHGIDIVLAAADRLRARRDIAFDLVGIGQMQQAAVATAAALRLPNVTFHPHWLPAEALIDRFIGPADICLGIFGAQPKAERVVPYKVYAALAAGRAVLTADTPAVREVLTPGEDVATVPPASDVALTDAIVRLADAPEVRERLARAGQTTWDARFAPPVLGGRLEEVLRELCAEMRT